MRFINSIKNFILDVIFPVECLGCGKEGSALCDDCFEKIQFSQNQICPICYKSSQSGKLCAECAGKSFLDRLVVCANYNNAIIQKSIKDLKYRYIEGLAIQLGKLMAKYVKIGAPDLDLSSFLITYVPLHKKRYLERGFNQSQLIAGSFCQHLSMQKPIDILGRKRYTINQASLKKKDRLENIKDAFICLKPDLAKGRSIIIIDDVFTTGATMQECAKVLKQNGAKEVIGLAVAHEN